MESAKKSLLWVRIACVIITAAAMFLLYRRIDLKVLVQTFRTMRWGWFLISFITYGLLFVPASWRWHLALRLNDSVVRFAATVRLSLIGHFFYTILFGAAGGDAAKCALYSRWYKRPMADLLVAASLDRLMGSGGLILFTGLAFGVAALHGGFAGLSSISLRWPGRWVLVVVALAVITLFLLKRSRRDSAWTLFADGFLVSGKKLVSSPRTLLPGILCGLLVQMALSAVLAMNLQAVSHAPLPWLRLAWTFPAISVISALPISIAGLGVRDSAAYMLLGLFGISGADAVAAALLTASISLAWAIVDGVLLWSESAQQREWRDATTVSLIIAAPRNETLLRHSIRRARAVPEVIEILVYEDGDDDRIRTIAAEQGCAILEKARSREAKMLDAIQKASGDVLLFDENGSLSPAHLGHTILRTLKDSTVVGGTVWNKAGSLHLAWMPCPGSGRRIPAAPMIFVRRDILQNIAVARNESKDSEDLPEGWRKAGRWVVVRSAGASESETCNTGKGQTMRPPRATVRNS